MLGNGYKERLANAQTNIGSLLQSLSKQQQQSSGTSGSTAQQQSNAEQHEPTLGSAFFQSKLMMTATTNGSISNTPSLPPVPAPVLESNSSSRHSHHSSQYRQQPNQQQHRTSRLPNAAFSVNRLFDGFPELNSPESSSSILHDPSFGLTPTPLSLAMGVSRPPSRWDANDDNHTPMSNSPRLEEHVFVPALTATSALSSPAASHKSGAGNSVHPRFGNDTCVGGTAEVAGKVMSVMDAVIIIQRAMRRFLVQKRARMDQPSLLANNDAARTLATTSTIGAAVAHGSNNIWGTTTPSRRQSSSALVINTTAIKATPAGATTVNMETLQQTCLRQSTEIDQLKELVTKMLLDSEEDRRKLRQRDREIEELMKQQQHQQKLTHSTSLASGFDAPTSSAASKEATASRFGHLTVGAKTSTAVTPLLLATSSTAPSFNTSAFGMDDNSSTCSGTTLVSPAVITAESVANSSALGVLGDDLYESNLSYANNIGGASAPIHPLSMPSRSNSITSLQHQHQQQQPHQNLSLKINASQTFYQQQYQGLMDMVDSPSSSDFPSQEASTPTGYGSGRGLSQHGYGSQTSFPMLNHRSSGSFSSSSRGAFDSPAIEQPGAYPWNAPAAGLTHSQSWADEMNSGYGYDAQAAGQYQHGAMGHSAGFDPQYINQQYGHSSQQQSSQPAQQQQQHHGLPPYRNNYRRHGEKPAHLDYQMCVDRILQATDQQASIHLQQKLKTSPPDQKLQIIDAILISAYPLMSNRFGNFLIQRCFEFGSPQQIDALAQAMRGNILTLACDPFGCHVVQKALDNVEEDCKARIVTEMFRRIRETIVHRYACHVWQKVFEIRWTDAPPAVMTYVNSAVAGRWAGVAVDETGSLVVQNIFENCAEHDKRPVLNEILQSVTTIAKGQWGNWVIQHILEHGSPADRATVTQKILEDAVSLSLDQYASKVVEKTLRMAATVTSSVVVSATSTAATTSTDATSIPAATPTTPTPTSTTTQGPPTLTINNTTTINLTQEEVMAQYILIVSNSVLPDRPRIPLIDIAADQYGNYIIQYILTNASSQHRETCAALIKRHMVSLRGSKYGQKVAFMVERWRGSPFGNGNGGGGNGNSNAGGALGQGNDRSGGGSGYGSKSGSGANGIEGNGGGGRRNRW
ncbi:hypothetical protein EC991_001047 [Linnemannia zychae]|nr:hypothetical protein EC991_001047 [Linnemannia zychae]